MRASRAQLRSRISQLCKCSSTISIWEIHQLVRILSRLTSARWAPLLTHSSQRQMHHVLFQLAWEVAYQMLNPRLLSKGQCTRGSCVRIGLRPVFADLETSASMLMVQMNWARITTCTSLSKPSNPMISTSPRTVAHSTGKSSVCMEKDATLDMNLEVLRKFIDISTFAIFLPWSTHTMTYCWSPKIRQKWTPTALVMTAATRFAR